MNGTIKKKLHAQSFTKTTQEVKMISSALLDLMTYFQKSESAALFTARAVT